MALRKLGVPQVGGRIGTRLLSNLRPPQPLRSLRPRTLRGSVGRTHSAAVYYPCYGDYVLSKQDDLEVLGLRSKTVGKIVGNKELEGSAGRTPGKTSESVDSSSHLAATAMATEGSHAIQTLEPLTSVQHEDEECLIPYHGTRVCTTVDVIEDPVNKTCTITIQGTLQSNQKWDTAQPFQATALKAIERAVHDLATKRSRLLLDESRWVDKEPLKRHHEITNILQYGKVVEAVPNPDNDFGHKSYRVKLKDRTTGHIIGALFKPRVYGDCDGWHRVPIEAAAYNLEMLLGLDTVPPAAVRKDVDVDWKRHREGTFCYWADDCQPLGDTPSEDWGVERDGFLSDTRILDVLMQNSDRHSGHFLRGRHWADGCMEVESGRWQGHVRPILIDHASGFRKDALVRLEDENAFQMGPTNKIVSSTYIRLRCLTLELLTEKMGNLLYAHEIGDVLHRRDSIIQYFDTLIAKQGFENVVLKCGLKG